jgi:hypothetical protein
MHPGSLFLGFSLFEFSYSSNNIRETSSDTKWQDNSNVGTNVRKAIDESSSNSGSTLDRRGNTILSSIGPSRNTSKHHNGDRLGHVESLEQMELSSSIVLGKDEKDIQHDTGSDTRLRKESANRTSGAIKLTSFHSSLHRILKQRRWY